MFLLQGENVQDNVHSIIAAAASKFSHTQFELLNKLIKDKWLESNDRIREKLLLLIGQIGKEAVNSKQVILASHWSIISILASYWSGEAGAGHPGASLGHGPYPRDP